MALGTFSQETFLEAIMRGTEISSRLLRGLQAITCDSRYSSMEMHGMAVQAQGRLGLNQKIVGHRAMRFVANSTILIHRFMFKNKGTLGMGMAGNAFLTAFVFHREGHIRAMYVMAIQTAHNTLIERMMRGHIE